MDRVVRHDGYVVCRNGSIFSPQRRELSQRLSSGYLRVNLNKVGTYVHRLIAEAFVPNPDNKPCVNHKDGDKTNNCVSNLEWVTHKENSQHATDTGLNPIRYGIDNGRSKLSDDDAADLRRCYPNRHKGWVNDMAKLHGVTHSVISKAARGINYTRAG